MGNSLIGWLLYLTDRSWSEMKEQRERQRAQGDERRLKLRRKGKRNEGVRRQWGQECLDHRETQGQGYSAGGQGWFRHRMPAKPSEYLRKKRGSAEKRRWRRKYEKSDKDKETRTDEENMGEQNLGEIFDVTWVWDRKVRFGEGRCWCKRRGIRRKRGGRRGTGNWLDDLRSENMRVAWKRGRRKWYANREGGKTRKQILKILNENRGCTGICFRRDRHTPETEARSSAIWTSGGRRCCEIETEERKKSGDQKRTEKALLFFCLLECRSDPYLSWMTWTLIGAQN